MDAMGRVMMIGGISAEFPLFRTLGPHIPYPSLRKIFDFRSVVDTYTQRAVRRARDQNNQSKIVFANILSDNENEKLKHSLSDKDIKSEATSFTIAGTDTTSIVLTYLTWAVLVRPQLQSQLEEELATLSDDFTDAQLEALPVLSGIVLETLRLYTAGPSSHPRRVPKGGVILEGHFIPKDVTISSQAYTMHRDERLFSNALECVLALAVCCR